MKSKIRTYCTVLITSKQNRVPKIAVIKEEKEIIFGNDENLTHSPSEKFP